MNARRTHLLPLLLVLLAACWLLPAPAEARDGPRREGQSYVKQLKPQELETLRRKLPEWDQLDRRKQERIAHNVIRLRNLSDEQRRRLEDRMGELGKRGKPDRPFRTEWMRFAQIVGESIWNDLSPAFHDEVTKRGVRPAMAKMVLFHKVKSHIAAQEGQAFTRDNLAALPRHLRAKAERLAAILDSDTAGEKDKRNARHRLGDFRAHVRIEALTHNLAAEAGNGAVPVERLTAALRKTWPEAFAKVVRHVEEDPARFAEMIAKRSRQGSPGLPGKRDGDRAGSKLRPGDFGLLVMQLERAARNNWKDRPNLQKGADGLVRQILVRELKVDAEAVRNLPGFDQPKERERAMRGILRRLLKRGDGKRSGMRGPRDGNGRRRPGDKDGK